MDTSDREAQGERLPRIGPGFLQWSGGGWFGSLIGGSAWLFLGSILLASTSHTLAWTWVTCGVVMVTVGVWLWNRRDRLLPYPAFMTLLLAQCICSCIAILGLVVLAPRSEQPFEANTWGALGALFVFPVLMIQLTYLERSAKPQASPD